MDFEFEEKDYVFFDKEKNRKTWLFLQREGFCAFSKKDILFVVALLGIDRENFSSYHNKEVCFQEVLSYFIRKKELGLLINHLHDKNKIFPSHELLAMLKDSKCLKQVTPQCSKQLTHNMITRPTTKPKILITNAFIEDSFCTVISEFIYSLKKSDFSVVDVHPAINYNKLNKFFETDYDIWLHFGNNRDFSLKKYGSMEDNIKKLKLSIFMDHNSEDLAKSLTQNNISRAIIGFYEKIEVLDIKEFLSILFVKLRKSSFTNIPKTFEEACEVGLYYRLKDSRPKLFLEDSK